MATRSKAQAPEARTVSVKGLVDDIGILLGGVDKAGASALEKKRAKMLLTGIRLLIQAYCIAKAPRGDLGNLTEFDVRTRGRK